MPKPANVENDYIFIVDMSGSNKQNCMPDTSGTGNCLEPIQLVPGTNPTGLMDFGAIQNFLNGLQQADPNNPNNYFALVEFATTGNTLQGLTNNMSGFQNLIQGQYNALNFNGWTDYLGALANLQSIVQNVITTEAQKAAQNLPTREHNIVVIWTTDGAPLVPNSQEQPTLENEQGIVNEITGIEQLAQTNSDYILSLQFNVVYYYVTDSVYSSYSPVAVQFLTDMTAAGDGRLFNVVSGSTPDYSAFIIPPINEPLTFAGSLRARYEYDLGRPQPDTRERRADGRHGSPQSRRARCGRGFGQSR